MEVAGGESEVSLLSLPPEIVQHLLSFLSLQDICQLGGVCRHLYAVTHCEAVWQLQVVRQYMVYWAGELDSLQAGLAEERRPLVATVCDPTLQGNREMAIIYSPQFRRIMIERNARTKQDTFRALLENSISDLLPRLLAFYVALPAEQQCSARLVLFGPGIESLNTKLVVEKIVNARSSTFDALEFVKGLPGGIGSGVRINYKHMYNFDLMCLYSNSASVRESVVYRGQGRGARLEPGLNKMLVQEPGGGLAIQPAIQQLLPTVHGLVFAVDTTLESEGEEGGLVEAAVRELQIMLDSQAKFTVAGAELPLLVLACRNSTTPRYLPLPRLVTGLAGLVRPRPRSWAAFEVCCDNMRGVERGLDWVLHHLAKRRREWKYHSKQGQH